VPRWVRVVPEHLHVSAGKVELHADELHARHIAAIGRIEAAQPGVPTTSALALSAAVTKWQADTTALHGSLVGYGRALRGAAAGYLTTEDHNASTLHSVSDEASSGYIGP
jgi:Excreted virulence factor EspC, type VII ESX diderm